MFALVNVNPVELTVGIKHIQFPSQPDTSTDSGNFDTRTSPADQDKYFIDIFGELRRCKTFAALVRKSNLILTNTQYDVPIFDTPSDHGALDNAASALLPNDVEKDLVPLKTVADGD